MQHLHWHWPTGGDKSNTGNVFTNIRSFIRDISLLCEQYKRKKFVFINRKLYAVCPESRISQSQYSRIFRLVFKTRKGTISYVVFIRLSVGREQLGSHWTDFHEI
jgi:hypothetical protein